MSYTSSELFNLALRWTHVVAAMLWIGQAALIAKWSRPRDRSMTINPPAAGESGNPTTSLVLDAPLLRWVAATTWISGFLLLGLLFHHGGALLVPDSPLGRWSGIALSLGVLPFGWLVYDVVWASPLSRRSLLATILSFGLLFALILGLLELLSPRAAYLHVGATLATIMAGNLWFRLLPAARRLEALDTPRASDPAAEVRARHNLHLAIPVVFTMLSGHFPVTTYGGPFPAGVLMLTIALGVGAAALLARR